MLLIEHNMHLIMGVSDRILVLDGGRPIAQGVPAEIRRNEAVIADYRGRLAALQGVSPEVHDGEVVCLVGPNGADTSTTLAAIAGGVAPRLSCRSLDIRFVISATRAAPMPARKSPYHWDGTRMRHMRTTSSII